MKEKKKLYYISAVSKRLNLHPQTLRHYEREGLITPVRSEGNTRLYDEETLQRIEVILRLTRDLGVNLAGAEVILNMREKMIRMQDEFREILTVVADELKQRRYRRGSTDLVPMQNHSMAIKKP